MRAGLLLPFLAVAAGAGAQDLPPEGTFTVNFTAVDTAPGLPVNIGPDRAFGTYEAVMTASNAEGGGLLRNLTGRCTGWYVVDASAGSYEQHGHCNYADPDGDEIWERFDFRGIPAMILFKDGKEIHRVIGFGGKAKLVAELEPHLA